MSNTKLYLVILPTILLSFMLYLSTYFKLDEMKIINFYNGNLREIFFSAFLTLSGFIFTLETFIIVCIKENVYDDPEYIKLYENKKKIAPELKKYAPLKRLKDFLFYTILYSFTAAVFQITLGLFNNWYALIVCIWGCVVALITFVVSLFIANNNLKRWFDFMEK